MVAGKLKFLICVHFHWWNSVLYEEKHFQKVKIDICGKIRYFLVKSSALNFTTIIADHSNIYDKISVFTKLWLVYHFINGFWYPRIHLLGPNWWNSRKYIFHPPPKTTFILKGSLIITRKLLNSQKIYRWHFC